MRYLLVLATALTLIGTSCQQNQQSNADATAIPPARQTPGTTAEGQVRLQARNPSEDPNNQSEQSKKVLQALTSNYWVITAWVERLDPELNRKNQGRYFQFKPDGTFESGQWAQPTVSGTWTFNGRTGLLYLDSPNDSEDGEWRIQINKDGSMMIWVGTERFQTTHIQVRLENLLFTPKNRQELGLKD